MQDRNTPPASAKTTPYRTLEGNVHVGAMSAQEKEPNSYHNDSIEDEEEDNIGTVNEISISQQVLEEAPLPDSTDRKISLKMIATPKDYALSEQVRLE